VLFAVFMVCVIELALATVVLLALGSRIRFSSRILGLLLDAAAVYGAGRLASLIWNLRSSALLGAEIFVFLVTAVVVFVRPVWNPVGEVFFGGYVAAALAYLAFAGWVTIDGGMSVVASIASGFLFLLELTALFLTASFAFEACDVLCRTRHTRRFPKPDPSYKPFVSLQIPSYNEPPEMLIDTIRTAENIDYPNFEIVVIDNNTSDPAMWRPVEEYCRGRERVKFHHVENLEGYKSGALNLALRSLTDPRAELIGVVDSDYRIAPNYLSETAPFFADSRLAFLQTPQDYREYKGNPYFTACYDAYRYFFSTSMPSRNERDSIIFAGTMGLLRRSVLVDLGGWDEWCITEDAEASLRMLRAGYSGVFIPRSYGQGIMPLTFASLKSQRFRWCFGGMQLLRKHWRSLRPWDHSPDNHLSLAQRFDYLVSAIQWLNDLVYLGFTLALLIIGSVLLTGHRIPVRPFVGPTVLLPAMLLASGLIRAVWALRQREHISYRRAFLAFMNWLSLSLTVARACVEGLLRPEGAFLRTPKTGGAGHRVRAALKAARGEAFIALVLLALGIGLIGFSHASPLVDALVLWQGSVYWSGPVMSWMNQRAELTPELEVRRRSEERRERLAVLARGLQRGTLVFGGGAAVVFAIVLALGASNPGHPRNPLEIPQRPATTPPASGRSGSHGSGAHGSGGHGSGAHGSGSHGSGGPGRAHGKPTGPAGSSGPSGSTGPSGPSGSSSTTTSSSSTSTSTTSTTTSTSSTTTTTIP
jgi:cellulose synthase/poly-beta-1,6-N-acetylglucosamine synthase-like glycosyltransferase